MKEREDAEEVGRFDRRHLLNSVNENVCVCVHITVVKLTCAGALSRFLFFFLVFFCLLETNSKIVSYNLIVLFLI